MAGKGPRFAGAALYDVVGALLQAEPGGEFLAAIRAAEECGCEVVLGDRSAGVTMERLRARLREAALQGRASGAQPRSPRVEEMAREALEVRLRSAGAACEPPELVLLSAQRLVAAALQGGPVDKRDLGRIRECGSAMVDHMRDQVLLDGGASDEAFTGMPPAAAAAVRATLVDERDFILARSLQLRPAAARVLGVVGAAHVRGIEREWAAVRGPAADARAAAYERPMPEELRARGGMGGERAVAAVGLATAALLAARRPGLVARLGGFVAGATAVSFAVAAAGVRRLEAAMGALAAADAELREEKAAARGWEV